MTVNKLILIGHLNDPRGSRNQMEGTIHFSTGWGDKIQPTKMDWVATGPAAEGLLMSKDGDAVLFEGQLASERLPKGGSRTYMSVDHVQIL